MATWSRSRLTFDANTRGVFMDGVIPTITLRASANTGKLRIGLWVADLRVRGWLIPFLPANVMFTIDHGRASAIVNGERRDVPRSLFDWDGVRFPDRNTLAPHGTLTLTLDQEPDKVVPVLVDISTAAAEAR